MCGLELAHHRVLCSCPSFGGTQIFLLGTLIGKALKNFSRCIDIETQSSFHPSTCFLTHTLIAAYPRRADKGRVVSCPPMEVCLSTPGSGSRPLGPWQEEVEDGRQRASLLRQHPSSQHLPHAHPTAPQIQLALFWQKDYEEFEEECSREL